MNPLKSREKIQLNGRCSTVEVVGTETIFLLFLSPCDIGPLNVPGHEWPGYKTTPAESGFSPIHGASCCNPVIYRWVAKDDYL
jgi:hypothetical protein